MPSAMTDFDFIINEDGFDGHIDNQYTDGMD